MKVLITGAGGQIGHDLISAFEGWDVVATDRTTLDVASRDSVLQAITSASPDAVVHTACWTAVDACESDPDKAMAVNALGTRHVAEAARLVGAHLCYISTDYVFDGTSTTPYTEWDDTNPQSVYGRSKLGGELELDPTQTIVRTSWVCGLHGSNFVKTMLRLADAGGEITVVDDQHGCPTFSADLAGMIRRLVAGRRPGTFHVTNSRPTTWFELAREVFTLAGHDAERVRPVAAADLQPPRPAPRPAYSVLDNAALRLSGIPLLPDHAEPLERLVKELLSS
ncbi:MAG: dTDP-4-dehydrorhamnose reductase [Actinomycetota bacterium]|nr:dTDP-4-dehydrorhamnose reductase [Actinomycetota bacterium]